MTAIRIVQAGVLLILAGTARAQEKPRPPAEPEIGPGGKVTFRLTAPKASEVSVTGEWGKPEPMTKDANGVWSATLTLAPNIYWYLFQVDGVRTVDPHNGRVKTGNSTQSYVEVPSDPPAFWAV